MLRTQGLFRGHIRARAVDASVRSMGNVRAAAGAVQRAEGRPDWAGAWAEWAEWRRMSLLRQPQAFTCTSLFTAQKIGCITRTAK